MTISVSQNNEKKKKSNRTKKKQKGKKHIKSERMTLTQK